MAQLTAAFEPNPLGPAIDAQGAVNEQATLYEDFVYNLWQQGSPRLAACGYRLPGWITARIARLPAFIAHATEPDGDLVQIGDTYVERPATSPRQPNLVAVYPGGYVFGRSSWRADASFYSLRFGRGRQVHGHDDHMGLTYYDRGRDLIKFCEFFDTAFGGRPRYRSVYVSQRPDLVLVLDRASGAACCRSRCPGRSSSPGRRGCTHVSVTIGGPPAGPYRLRVLTGSAVAEFAITANGVIS